MSLIVKGSDSEFTPCPEGCWPAVCCDVVDLGLKDTRWGRKDMLQIRWQTNQERDDGKPHEVRKNYTKSLHEKANLCKDLERWRGKKFIAKDREGFDIEKLLGVNCQLVIVHNLSDDGRLWANVDSVLKPANESIKLRVTEEYTREEDRENGQHVAVSGEQAAETVEEEQVPF